jgi:methylmalonyl-CoA mutase N-terminal domain/subunit
MADPFGGSYCIEQLTDDLEAEASAYIARIDGMGGMVAAIERGFPQAEIAESAYRYQCELESKARLVVGLNDFVTPEERPVQTLYVDASVGDRQAARLGDLRARRHVHDVAQALDGLREAAVSGANTMPALVSAARCYATVGEMCDALRQVWGEYVETPTI